MAAADLRNKAKEAFRRKNYDLAVEVYLESLRQDANDAETVEGFFAAAKKARESKGKGMFGGSFLSKISLSGTRDPQKRMETCFRALAKNPEDKSLLMSMAEGALESGALEAAIGGFRRAADADPNDNLAFKHLGEALGRRGRIQEALLALDQAVKINPRDQDAIKLRKNIAAEGALKLSGYETAKSSRDLIKNKDEARQLEVETRIQLTPEHAASEVDKTREQIKAEPTNGRLFVRLGDLLLQQNDEEGATLAFEGALKLDPRNFDLSVRIGDIRLRRLETVMKEARAAAQAAPGDGALKSRHEAAYTALRDGQIDEYGRRVREHPLDLGERFKLGRALLAAGRTEEATGEFQQTVRDPNRKIDSLLLLAKCFEKSNLLTLALKKIEEAVAEFPSLNSPRAKEVHYAHADLLARTGDRQKARQVFERIYEEDIGYRDVSARLKELATA